MRRNLLKIFLVLLLFSATTCAPRKPSFNLPDQVAAIDPLLVARANIILSGIFKVGRSPCELLPDGTRRWRRTTGFKIEQVVLGSVSPGYIEVHLRSSVDEPVSNLDDGQRYFMFLAAETSLNDRLQKSDNLYFGEALSDKDVVAIVSENGEVLYKRQENI